MCDNKQSPDVPESIVSWYNAYYRIDCPLYSEKPEKASWIYRDIVLSTSSKPTFLCIVLGNRFLPQGLYFICFDSPKIFSPEAKTDDFTKTAV